MSLSEREAQGVHPTEQAESHRTYLLSDNPDALDSIPVLEDKNQEKARWTMSIMIGGDVKRKVTPEDASLNGRKHAFRQAIAIAAEMIKEGDTSEIITTMGTLGSITLQDGHINFELGYFCPCCGADSYVDQMATKYKPTTYTKKMPNNHPCNAFLKPKVHEHIECEIDILRRQPEPVVPGWELLQTRGTAGGAHWYCMYGRKGHFTPEHLLAFLSKHTPSTPSVISRKGQKIFVKTVNGGPWIGTGGRWAKAYQRLGAELVVQNSNENEIAEATKDQEEFYKSIALDEFADLNLIWEDKYGKNFLRGKDTSESSSPFLEIGTSQAPYISSEQLRKILQNERDARPVRSAALRRIMQYQHELNALGRPWVLNFIDAMGAIESFDPHQCHAISFQGELYQWLEEDIRKLETAIHGYIQQQETEKREHEAEELRQSQEREAAATIKKQLIKMHTKFMHMGSNQDLPDDIRDEARTLRSELPDREYASYTGDLSGKTVPELQACAAAFAQKYNDLLADAAKRSSPAAQSTGEQLAAPPEILPEISTMSEEDALEEFLNNNAELEKLIGEHPALEKIKEELHGLLEEIQQVNLAIQQKIDARDRAVNESTRKKIQEQLIQLRQSKQLLEEQKKQKMTYKNTHSAHIKRMSILRERNILLEEALS